MKDFKPLIYTAIIGIVGLIIVLQIIAGTASSVTTSLVGAGTNLTGNGTGSALAGSFFGTGNSIMLIVLIVVFFLIAMGMAWNLLRNGGK